VSPDIPASIHQRLLNQARAEGRLFNELLQYYALDRFLYRLGRSDCASRFVLKGALLLAVWHAPITRPTRDIDLLGETDNALAAIVAAMQDICRQPAPGDGLVYDDQAVTALQIAEGARYTGVRVRFWAYLGKARIPMQIDVGFGDALIPGPQMVALPAPLGLPRAVLLGYTAESVVAEKLQIMAALGEINSRLKDYYDLWLLATHHTFEGSHLAQAIQATFTRRETRLTWPLAGLQDSFANEAREAQWSGFRHRLRLAEPATLRQAIEAIRPFVGPVTLALCASEGFTAVWRPGGPWQHPG
jgi:hypothetical protein